MSAPLHPTRPSRYQLVAAAILAGIGAAAALVHFGLRGPAAPAMVAAEPAVPPLAAGEYDLDTAFSLAGEQVPQMVQEYYFVALIEDVPPQQEAAELAQKLKQAARERDYLGITGPDPARNRRTLLAALAILRDEPLDGLMVIYLGPAEQQIEIVRLLQSRGASPRFVIYPALGLAM